MKYLYTIKNPCGIVFFTKDPIYAQEASKAGCMVTCKNIGFNRKFKASSNINKNNKPETFEVEG